MMNVVNIAKVQGSHKKQLSKSPDGMLAVIFTASFLCCLPACSSGPPAPDWQANAQSSMERSIEAYLAGNARVDAQEFTRAKSEVARTGRADLMARIELMRCASQVAGLAAQDCDGFERLRQDAAKPERVYADYLAGKSPLVDAELLPPQHRAVAIATTDVIAAQALQTIADPVAKLVAAGVIFRRGQASPVVISTAIDTASAQGFRRPLLAWLGVQRLRAEKAGDSVEVARIQRRIALVGDAPPVAVSPVPPTKP